MVYEPDDLGRTNECIEGAECVSLELALDLRRFLRRALLIRFAVVLELDLASESLSLDESELEELDEFSISARTPGYDSSSIICWGVLS